MKAEETKTETTDTDQAEEETTVPVPAFEDLHRGQLVLRFDENATLVKITWEPDAPAEESQEEEVSLLGEEFDGECFRRCVAQCKGLMCVLRCVVKCG